MIKSRAAERPRDSTEIAQLSLSITSALFPDQLATKTSQNGSCGLLRALPWQQVPDHMNQIKCYEADSKEPQPRAVSHRYS